MYINITNNLNYQRYEVNCIPSKDCVIFIFILRNQDTYQYGKTCQKENILF